MTGKLLLTFITGLVATVFAASCGNDDNLQRVEVSELTIEGSDGNFNIKLPVVDDKPEKQLSPLILRNSGKAMLVVNRFEWVAKPDRLDALAEAGGACTTGDECSGTEICLSSRCIALGLPATPFNIEPSLRKDIEFVVTQGGGELTCPTPGPDVPANYLNSYCGELVIETNAINTSGVVQDGKATIYFLKPALSGQIEVQPEFMEFQNVLPGSQQSQDFSIRNTGSQLLTVEQFNFSTLGNFLKVTAGENLPLEIEPGTSASWTLSVEVPSTATAADYEGFAQLQIESSAVNANDGNISIQVSEGSGSAPAIDVSATSLLFSAQAEQTLTVDNVGEATLQVTSLSVTPASARPFYKFFIDGNDVTTTFPTQNIPKSSSVDIVVKFERPNGNTDSSVATLQLRHNDRNANNLSEVTLLGDEGDVPIARVYPQSFTFLAADGNNSTRSFVIRNVGTADLVVSGSSYNFSTGSDAEFSVSNIAGTIAPGGMKIGTVTFAGANAAPDVGLVVIESNDASSQTDIAVKAIDSPAEAVTAVITPSTTNDVRVGSTALFNASASTPAGVATSGLWTLLERPAGSTVFFSLTGEELRFVPDVAGSYKIALLTSANQREAQVTYDLTVVP